MAGDAGQVTVGDGRADRAWLLLVALVVGVIWIGGIDRPSGATEATEPAAPACADGTPAQVVELPSGETEGFCGAAGNAEAASISLTKTVGTDEATCSADDEISVVADTEVFYCYTVANTGPATMTVHDLEDDQLGTVLDGFEYTLAPGATASVTRSATIAEDTVNLATWTATDGVETAQASDTASVVIVSAAAPGAPVLGQVTVGEGRASVSWSPPDDDGGSPITGYVVTPYAGATALASTELGADARSFVADGLANGVAHTLRIAARNAAGLGPEATSSAVTPQWWLPWSSGTVAVNEIFTWMTGAGPSAAQRTSWLDQLNAGTAKPGDLVAALRAGPDATGNVDPVVRLYSAYLTRIPDASGLNFWLSRRRSGWTLARISANFAASSEFERRYGSLTNRQFVQQIYLNVLGRTGDPAGIDYWTRQLDTGRRSRGQVMLNFSDSSEYVRKQVADVHAAVVFIHLVGRAPTVAERDDFVASFDGGTPLATLVRALIAAPGFAARAG